MYEGRVRGACCMRGSAHLHPQLLGHQRGVNLSDVALDASALLVLPAPVPSVLVIGGRVGTLIVIHLAFGVAVVAAGRAAGRAASRAAGCTLGGHSVFPRDSPPSSHTLLILRITTITATLRVQCLALFTLGGHSVVPLILLSKITALAPLQVALRACISAGDNGRFAGG